MRDEWLKPPPPNLMLPNSVPHPSLALIDVDPIYLWIYIQRLLLCPQAPRTNVPTSKALLSKKKMMKKKNSNSMKVFKKKNLTTTKKNKKRKNFPFQKNIFVFIFRARQKVLFSVKLSSFSPLFHCRLVGAVVTPSLVIQKMLLPPHISPVFFLYYY